MARDPEALRHASEAFDHDDNDEVDRITLVRRIGFLLLSSLATIVGVMLFTSKATGWYLTVGAVICWWQSVLWCRRFIRPLE